MLTKIPQIHENKASNIDTKSTKNPITHSSIKRKNLITENVREYSYGEKMIEY